MAVTGTQDAELRSVYYGRVAQRARPPGLAEARLLVSPHGGSAIPTLSEDRGAILAPPVSGPMQCVR